MVSTESPSVKGEAWRFSSKFARPPFSIKEEEEEEVRSDGGGVGGGHKITSCPYQAG